jgi:hypothetical protein
LGRVSRKGFAVSRLQICIPALLFLALPAQAEDFQTIGSIEAEFDGATLSQTTMSYLDAGKRLATASLASMSGLTTLTIQAAEGKPIVIEAMFTTAEPNPQSPPLDLSISYFPSGLKSFWTSEDAPEPARTSFDRLDTGTDDLHASGTFEALLCRVPEGAYESDTSDCQPITGRFDTGLVRE